MRGCRLPRGPLLKPRQRRLSDASATSTKPKKHRVGKGKRAWIRSIITRKFPVRTATKAVEKHEPIILDTPETPIPSPWLAGTARDGNNLQAVNAIPPPFHKRRRSSQFRLSASNLLLIEEVRSPRPTEGEQYVPMMLGFENERYCGIEIELHNMCSIVRTTTSSTGKVTIRDVTDLAVREVTDVAVAIAKRTTFAIVTKFLWPIVKAKATTTLLFPTFELPTFKPSSAIRDFAASTTAPSQCASAPEQSTVSAETIKTRLKKALSTKKKRNLVVNTSVAGSGSRESEDPSPQYHPKRPDCNLDELILSAVPTLGDQDEEHPSPQYHRKRFIDDERFPGLFNKPRLSSSFATVASYTFHATAVPNIRHQWDSHRQETCELSETPFSTLLRSAEVVTDYETAETDSRPGTADSNSSWLSPWDTVMPGGFVMLP